MMQQNLGRQTYASSLACLLQHSYRVNAFPCNINTSLSFYAMTHAKESTDLKLICVLFSVISKLLKKPSATTL